MSFLRRFTYTQHLSIIMIHRVTEERKHKAMHISERKYICGRDGVVVVLGGGGKRDAVNLLGLPRSSREFYPAAITPMFAGIVYSLKLVHTANYKKGVERLTSHLIQR